MNDDSAEEWRPVLGFEEYYEVSSAGRARSLDRIVTYRGRTKPWLRLGRQLTVFLTGVNYPTVMLTRLAAAAQQA